MLIFFFEKNAMCMLIETFILFTYLDGQIFGSLRPKFTESKMRNYYTHQIMNSRMFCKQNMLI